MRALLEKARERAEQAEVYHLKQRTVPVEFTPGGVSAIEVRHIEGVALRAVVDDRLGYAASTDMEHPKAMVDSAVAMAAHGEACCLTFPDVAPDLLDGICVPETEALEAEQLLHLGDEVCERIGNARSDIETTTAVRLVIDEVRVVNTNGLDVKEKSALIEIEIGLSRSRLGEILVLEESFRARAIQELTAERCTDRLVNLLELAQDTVPAPSGETAVVFAPSATVACLLPILMGMNGKLVLAGLSPLAQKVGQRVFDPKLGLVDDGRNAAGAIAGSFDVEGVPMQRTPLVERGIVCSFYHDLTSAQLANREPTGNGLKGGLKGVLGQRGFRPSPEASFSNVVVDSGAASQDELIREIKNGLLVDTVLGLGQGNLFAGEFSNNVSVAYRIENGRITGRVKDVMISGNSYDLLRNHVIGVGNDPQWFMGRLLSPSLAVAGVSVTAR
jgi:PmbA protein